MYRSFAMEVEDSIAYNPTLSPFSKAVLVTRVLVLLTFVVNVIGTVPEGVSESILLTQAANKWMRQSDNRISLFFLIVVLFI